MSALSALCLVPLHHQLRTTYLLSALGYRSLNLNAVCSRVWLSLSKNLLTKAHACYPRRALLRIAAAAAATHGRTSHHEVVVSPEQPACGVLVAGPDQAKCVLTAACNA